MREAGHDVDIRTQSGVTIWCQVRSGEDDKGEGGGKRGEEMSILAGDDVWEVGIGWKKRCPVGAGHDVREAGHNVL